MPISILHTFYTPLHAPQSPENAEFEKINTQGTAVMRRLKTTETEAIRYV